MVFEHSRWSFVGCQLSLSDKTADDERTTKAKSNQPTEQRNKRSPFFSAQFAFEAAPITNVFRNFDDDYCPWNEGNVCRLPPLSIWAAYGGLDD